VGHERINKAAVMALPKPMQVFFTTILILSLKSTVPDLQIYSTRQSRESRHYFDMENFGSVDSFPKNHGEAKI
jgi:hypothetical protein